MVPVKVAGLGAVVKVWKPLDKLMAVPGFAMVEQAAVAKVQAPPNWKTSDSA